MAKDTRVINAAHGSITEISRLTGHSRGYIRECLRAYGMGKKDFSKIRKMAIQKGGSYVM